jgi:hypothetical protein
MKNDEKTNTNPERKKLRSKWLDPNADRARRSNQNERRLAKRLGGKRIARSGGKLWSSRLKGASARGKGINLAGVSGTTEGGDVAVKEFHFENKRTINKSMSVQRAWLLGITEAARQAGKDPGLILTFENGRKPPEDWVALPLDVFERLRKKVT